MSPVHHLLDVYDTHLHCATNKRAWATLRRRYPGLVEATPESAGLCRVATWHPKDGGMHEFHLVLWINLAQHKTEHELIDTCAHEATHAALSVMDHIGHDSRGTNDEPVAYLVGWITRWLWNNAKEATP